MEGAITKCGGQDIYDVACSNCGTEVEFWKDDRSHKCPECGQKVENPRFADEEAEEQHADDLKEKTTDSTDFTDWIIGLLNCLIVKRLK